MTQVFFFAVLAFAFGIAQVFAISESDESPAEIEKIVADLDTEFQAAVERNDADTMDRILADDMVLVLGNGTVYTKTDQLEEARSKIIVYEQQKEIDNSQRVRVWENTAVVTAKLWIKGTREGKAFERKVWFSDIYVKTKKGWQYVFGQASLPLPKEP
ncbi:nuclear transport factor 2 family protein [bacterium]|nr:nuclear transport factor 2 family protein [bacterium]MCI0603285.1 nuclear transport factor 2 family protein [bacterium]